jgi:lysophospholipid acyltransferase (LPLAT)-like uncharacterized protein
MSLFKKVFANNIVISAASFIAFLWVWVVQMLSWTKYRNVGRLKKYVAGGKPVIVVMWHSRSLFINKVWGRRIGIKRHPIQAIFSAHRDGRLIGSIYERLGIKNILSSSKSVADAKAVTFKVLRLLKSGVSIGITPDGPLGPAMTFTTDSAFLFARSTGAPIVPLYISANRARFLKTWDRFMLIKPFSKSVIEAGDFVFIDKEATPPDIARAKASLTKTMVEKTVSLDREMGLVQP